MVLNFQKNILISIGDQKFKYEFLSSLRILSKLGFTLYGTEQTYLFCALNNIEMVKLDMLTILDKLDKSEIDLIINIPTSMYNSENKSNGFIMRRKCIDVNIPLITNIKCARLFVASLRDYIKNGIDYKSWDEYVMNN